MQILKESTLQYYNSYKKRMDSYMNRDDSPIQEVSGLGKPRNNKDRKIPENTDELLQDAFNRIMDSNKTLKEG